MRSAGLSGEEVGFSSLIAIGGGQDGGKEQIQIRETEGREYVVYKYYYDQDELKQLI